MDIPLPNKLVDENQFLTYINQELSETLNRLKLKVFSSKYRQELFGSYTDSRVETISGLLKELHQLIITFDILEEKAKKFRSSFNLVKPLSLKRHHTLAMVFLKEAISSINNSKKKVSQLVLNFELLNKDLEHTKRQKVFHNIKDLFDKLIVEVKENNVRLADFKGRYRVEEYLQKTVQQLLDQNIYRGKGYMLKSGDIFLSFKTKAYLSSEKGPKISNWVSRFSGSQVTHSGIFMIGTGGVPKMIHAFRGFAYGIEDLNLKEGEVYIVLRPKLSGLQRANLWAAIRKRLANLTRYSTAKMLWVVPTVFANKLFHLFGKRVEAGGTLDSVKSKMFCSEFVNQVFLDVGFLLTPKSKYSLDVYPSDIIVSPFVDYVGILFKDDDYTIEKIEQELLKGVKI